VTVMSTSAMTNFNSDTVHVEFRGDTVIPWSQSTRLQLNATMDE